MITSQMSQERNIFPPNKKINELHIKVYFIAKHSFVVDTIFKKTEYLKTHELKNSHSIIVDD